MKKLDACLLQREAVYLTSKTRKIVNSDNREALARFQQKAR